MHRIASEVGQQVKTVNNQECLKQAFTICISNDPDHVSHRVMSCDEVGKLRSKHWFHCPEESNEQSLFG